MTVEELKRVWKAMHNRCYNVEQKSYPDYGGRGIFVDQRWHGKDGFLNFLWDMGARPDGASIDRIDNDGSYSPENCRWATKDEQSRNKRNNRWITANGETLCLKDWANRLGCTPSGILRRIENGWTEEKAVTTPVEDRPNAKLTPEKAVYIVRTYPAKTAQAIATELGVSKKSILNVLHGKTFYDVTGIRH